MPRDSILLDLLCKPDWEQFQPLVDQLQSWTFYPLFLRAVENLNLSVLYESDIHGIGHIERTICHGAMCAMDEALDEADTGLRLQPPACYWTPAPTTTSAAAGMDWTLSTAVSPPGLSAWSPAAPARTC